MGDVSEELTSEAAVAHTGYVLKKGRRVLEVGIRSRAGARIRLNTLLEESERVGSQAAQVILYGPALFF